MKQQNALALLLLLLCAAPLWTGCDEGEDYAGGELDCGDGDSFSYQEESFCIYRSAIIEEGFLCPPERPQMHSFGGFVACSGGEQLPVGFEGAVREVPGYEAPSNNFNNTTNNGEPDNTQWLGDCVETGGLEALPVRFIYEGNLYLTDQEDRDTTLFTLESQEELNALFTSNGVEIAQQEIDFETEVVIGSRYYISSTCGISVEAYGYHATDAGPLLAVTYLDSSGGCDGVCDAEGSQVLLLAVQRPTQEVRHCREILPGCQDE